MNVFEYAVPEKREGADREWYAIEPGKMYPAMIAEIQDVLATGRAVPASLALHRNEAQALPEFAWGLALKPRSEFNGPEPAVTDLLKLRAEALNVARRWFTEMLHTAIGYKPMCVHILKDPDWKD